MSERDRELIMLATVLRKIHHRRYMSIDVYLTHRPWWAFWRSRFWPYEIRDEVGNVYDELPYPLGLPGMYDLSVIYGETRR